MRNRIIIIFVTIFISSNIVFASNIVERQLPSGKVIKIKSITKLFFKKDKPALALEYVTESDIKDVDSLRKEAEEIWPVFRTDVEKAQMVNAIIKASEPKKTSVFGTYKYTSYSFIINKKENGIWNFYSWGRDYDSESSILSGKFLESIKNHESRNAAKLIHFPPDFKEDQREIEIENFIKVISVFRNKLGAMTSYGLNKSPILHKHLFWQTASLSYWNQYPFFTGQIYDVKYSDNVKGIIAIRFSIINDKLEIHSILFGFPAEDPHTEVILKEILSAVIKAESRP